MLRTAACEKLFTTGACDSHAPVGPAPPSPSHRRSAKSVTIAPACGHSLWALWVMQTKPHRRWRRARGPFQFVGHLGCKIKVRFRFLFGLPKTPTKLGGKMRGTERRGALGVLGCSFQVAPKFSYCEPFLTTYNFNNFSS